LLTQVCCELAHEPQLSDPPHPSDAVPHCRPSVAHVAGWHTHALPTHTCCAPVQAPQASVPPHPSEIDPHAPAGQVVRGWHTHRYAVQTD
jgi:hypothetical protein